MKSVHAQASMGSRAEQAAQAIMDLINSRPRSPRRDEIEAIIDKLADTATGTVCCPQCAALDREYGPAAGRRI